MKWGSQCRPLTAKQGWFLLSIISGHECICITLKTTAFTIYICCTFKTMNVWLLKEIPLESGTDVGKHWVRSDINVPPQSQQVLAVRTVQSSVSFWWFLKLTVIIMCLHIKVTPVFSHWLEAILWRGCVVVKKHILVYAQCKSVSVFHIDHPSEKRNQTAHMTKYSGC